MWPATSVRSAWVSSRASSSASWAFAAWTSDEGGGGLGGVHGPHRQIRGRGELTAYASHRAGHRVGVVGDRCHGSIPALATDTGWRSQSLCGQGVPGASGVDGNWTFRGTSRMSRWWLSGCPGCGGFEAQALARLRTSTTVGAGESADLAALELQPARRRTHSAQRGDRRSTGWRCLGGSAAQRAPRTSTTVGAGEVCGPGRARPAQPAALRGIDVSERVPGLRWFRGSGASAPSHLNHRRGRRVCGPPRWNRSQPAGGDPSRRISRLDQRWASGCLRGGGFEAQALARLRTSTTAGAPTPAGGLPVPRRGRQRVGVVVDDVRRAAGAAQPGGLELRAVVGAPHARGEEAAGSLTTTSPEAVKPTITSRWPAVEEIGAPCELPRRTTPTRSPGCRRRERPASDSERSRVTKACSPREAAYAVLNGQLPVPS